MIWPGGRAEAKLNSDREDQAVRVASISASLTAPPRVPAHYSA